VKIYDEWQMIGRPVCERRPNDPHLRHPNPVPMEQFVEGQDRQESGERSESRRRLRRLLERVGGQGSPGKSVPPVVEVADDQGRVVDGLAEPGVV
jgi:hypothetical protein